MKEAVGKEKGVRREGGRKESIIIALFGYSFFQKLLQLCFPQSRIHSGDVQALHNIKIGQVHINWHLIIVVHVSLLLFIIMEYPMFGSCGGSGHVWRGVCEDVWV